MFWLRQAGVICLCFAFVGCKSLVRERYAEPQAVGDSHRVLGLVPVVRYDVRAYRLLVCKRLHNYPKEVLADQDSCRVALHDHDGNEVAFFSSDFQRSLVTKYRGYAKQAAVAALVTVPIALVGVLAGSWRMLRFTNKEIKHARALRLQDFEQGKYSEALINDGVGRVGVRYYMHAWSEVATRMFDDIKNSADAGEVKAKLAELEQLTSSYRTATAVSAMTGAKKTLEHLRYAPHKQAQQTIARIERKLIKENNGTTSFSAKGSFGNDFFLLYKQLQSLFNSAEEGANLERLQALAERIELLAKDYVIKAPKYEKLYADSSVLAIERSSVDFERYFKHYLDELADKKARLLADSRMRSGVEMEHVQERTLIKSAVAGGAGGAVALGALNALDKSIWGYEDRQLNRYWQHVFVADDDWSNPLLIADLPQLLHALADAFGYQVNAAALEL